MTIKFLSILFLVATCAASSAHSGEDGFNATEVDPTQVHLSYGHGHSMTVMWNTIAATETFVRYYKGHCDAHTHTTHDVEGSQFQYADDSAFVHTVFLKDVTPSEPAYCYQVGDPNKLMSKWREWKNPDKDRAVFAVLADTGTWGEVLNVMKNLAADEDVGMVIHGGDLSYAQKEDVWNTWGNIVEPVASTRPYMILPGNWDVKPFAIVPFLSRYQMPLVHTSNSKVFSYYYTYTYSLVRIVMMSSYDPYEPGSKQYEWVRATLREANNNRQTHPWLVLCFHSPMYSSSEGHKGPDGKGGDPVFRAAMEKMLIDYKVDVAITGHDHGYERSYPVFNETVKNNHISHYEDPKYPIHILAGVGGATADPWIDPRPEWSARREGTYGYIRFVATATQLHAQYLRTNHTTGDEFWIKRADLTPSRPPWLVFGFIALFMGVAAYHYRKIPGLTALERAKVKEVEGEFGKHV